MVEKYDSINSFVSEVVACGGSNFGQQFISTDDKKEKILLVSHDMSLTGAPVALEQMAKALVKLGKAPLVISPIDGPLKEDFIKNELPVLIVPNLLDVDIIKQAAYLFDAVVVNTIIPCKIVSMLNGSDTPVLWWIHEAELGYNYEVLCNMPHWLFQNVSVVTAGPRAMAHLKKFRPLYCASELLYCIPDISNMENYSFELPKAANGKRVFALIGTVNERKGQDILLEAIKLLPNGVSSQCHFVFVGEGNSQPILNASKKWPELITHIPSISREKIPSFYQHIFCEVCASRDDPMPIVITEALCVSRIVISSENVGQASMLKRHHAGVVYCDNSAENLAQCITDVVNASEPQLETMRMNGRRLFEERFSEPEFNRNVQTLFNEFDEKQIYDNKETVKMIQKIEESFKKDYFSELEKCQAEYESSRSWRITAPLRKVTKILRKIKNGK